MDKTIGVLTGGGDAPGLNAYLRGISATATRLGVRVLGLRNGFDGLLRPERHDGKGLVDLPDVLDRRDVFEPGSVLGAASSGFPSLSGEYARELVSMLRDRGLDALLMIGGEGTQAISRALHRADFPVIGLPKTIDNDLPGTPCSIGFDSAVEFLADSMRGLRRHAVSHGRVVLLETMGRNTGWLALCSALAGDADGVLIPEMPYRLAAVEEFVRSANSSLLLVVAEGAHERETPAPRAKGLGGVSRALADRLEAATGREVRAVVPSHLQRAASPVASDRLLGLRLGSAAVERLLVGERGVLLYWDGSRIRSAALAETSGVRSVPLDGDDLRTARSLGIFLGEHPLPVSGAV